MGAMSRTEVLLSLVLMVAGRLLACSVLNRRDEVGDQIKPFPFVVILCVLGEHGGSVVLLQSVSAHVHVYSEAVASLHDWDPGHSLPDPAQGALMEVGPVSIRRHCHLGRQ